MWKLVIEDDEGKRTVVPLTRDEYTIGRKEGNTIRLTERNVSRDHAKLGRRPGPTKEKPIFTLGDVSSYNGVYVNGLRVADKQDLANGDLIQIGDYRIVLHDETVEATDGAPAEDGAIPLDPDDLKETVSTGPVVPLALRATNATFLEKPNRLVVLAGPNPGEEFPLVGERLTIGRAEDATISINHNSVSRLHCEVHSLGEARFEIVDKGSSNGVRVNGADLRRGIIEAGDIIELGDVKFKFVGEGQLFRPGTESQQLAAISHRAGAGPDTPRPTAKRSLVPVIGIAVVAAIGVIAVLVMKGGKETPAPVPETTSASAATDTTGIDAAMLAEARRMCDIGDVEGAHDKANTLPAASPLHTSADYLYVELKWAGTVLSQASSEADPAKKAALYQRIIGDTYADPTMKKMATANLASIDTTGKPVSAAGTGRAPAPGTVAVSRPQPNPGVPAPPPPEVTPPPPPPPRTVKPQQSIAELMLSNNPDDVQKARTLLERKVFAHKGSKDEIRMLLNICKQQHDTGCVNQCRQEQNH